MPFQKPFIVTDEDKVKLKTARDALADLFPSFTVTWKPGRKAIDTAKRVGVQTPITWKSIQDDQENPLFDEDLVEQNKRAEEAIAQLDEAERNGKL